jgi:ribose 5-phosphate isomerase B
MESLFIASDHAGFELKQKIISALKNLKFEDLGPHAADAVDYPDYAHRLALRMEAALVGEKTPPRGILICGSGQGMAMAANKHPHVRAALCWSEESARLARLHNDANVLCLSSRLVDETTNLKIIKVFFETAFEGGRHAARVNKIQVRS